VPVLLWDASALIKRYAPEAGTDVVDALFAEVPPSQMITTFWGYVETYAGLVRKRNRGDIAPVAFQTAAAALQQEILDSLDYQVISVEDLEILGGFPYIEGHNLNATDAAILVTYLRYARARPPNAPRSSSSPPTRASSAPRRPRG
jgi:predicted nucleic acid-binding protein